METNQNPKENLLRLAEVRKKTGMEKSTIYAQMMQGLFPRAVKISQRSVAWLESEIDQWISERVQKSRTKV